MVFRPAWIFMACLVLAGCTAPSAIPTANSISMSETAQYVTDNAPPAPFDQGVQFPQIDDNLGALPSSHYTVSLSFDGVFSGSQEKTQGSIEAEVFSNELGSARRVILKASGKAFGLNEDRNVEGVRISNDYYVVDPNKICTKVKDTSPRQIADLSAGTLIGGIKKAAVTPDLRHKPIGSVEAWEYIFLPDDVIPPVMDRSNGGTLSIAAGDLWVAPAWKAVVLYNISLNIENTILQGNRELTGQVRGSYKLLDTGVDYNISIPYGC
jgi:hypothetical protein